jgi:hypothetical protein
MHMRIILQTLAATAALLLGAGTALGLVMDGQGHVTDWGITPLSQPNQSDVHSGGVWSTISNNYSPVSYPGAGHVPYPGGTVGETFDLEGMYMSYGSPQLRVLLVASSPWAAASAGNTFNLGDLFITVGGQQYGIVTQQSNSGLAAGSIYRIDQNKDTLGLQPGNGSWAGSHATAVNDYGPADTIENIVGPWAVSDKIKSDQLLGAATLQSASFDYGGAENGTFLLQYTFDPTLLGITSDSTVTSKITWGSGNDVIRLVDTSPLETPEPSSLGLLAAGVGLIAAREMAARRRLCPVRT